MLFGATNTDFISLVIRVILITSPYSNKIWKESVWVPFDLGDVLYLIGAYEPRWMMEGQHVSPDEAVQMHIDTQSKKSIGIHWGTWALANEFYLEPREKLVTKRVCRK